MDYICKLHCCSHEYSHLIDRAIQRHRYGHIKIAKWLHQLGADIHAECYCWNAFMVACQYGHIEVAKWLYRLGVDIHIHDEYAFRLSCKNGHIEVRGSTIPEQTLAGNR